MMFRSYLVAAIRHFSREKAYALINVIGLALGLAVFVISIQSSYVGFHYDEFHANADRLYGVVQVRPTGQEGDKPMALVPGPLAPVMRSEFPEVEDAVRFLPARRTIVRTGDKKFYEDGILYADKNFFSIFSFRLLSGEPEKVLSRPDAVVLTETAARKYFGEANPLGERLSISRERDAVVTGVVEDVPLDSSLRFDFLLPLEALPASFIEDWQSRPFSTFVLLRKGVRPERLEEKFPDFIRAHMSGSPDSPRRLFLMPLTGFFHRPGPFLSHLGWNSPTELYLALFVGFFFLAIVAINSTSLSIARSLSRTKEVGVRKVAGANRAGLVRQFIGESMFMAVVSLVLALPLFSIIQDLYVSLFGLGAKPTVTAWNSPLLVLTIIGVTLLTGVLSGLYPALYLSRLNPATVFREGLPAGRRGGRVRKILMAVQFGLSIFFILFSLAAKGQYDYFLKQDFGFNRRNVLVIPVNEEILPRLDSLRESLKVQPGILGTASASVLPIKVSAELAVIPEGLGRESALAMDVFGVDHDFIGLMGIRVEGGRSFSRDFNDEASLVINQTALKRLGWDDPLGRRLVVGETAGTVVGVVRDFQFRNMIFPTPPTVLVLRPDRSRYLFVRLDPSRPAASLMPAISAAWDAVVPNIPLESFLLEHAFADAYGDIGKASQASQAIGFGTILFSCLGMLGLVSFVLRRKTKEIGIRKTMGASAGRIFLKVMREFVLLVVLANVVTLPLAYVLLNKLIRTGYAFSTKINLAGFLLVAVLSILGVGLAILNLVLAAARQNPVHSLRYE
ncbi:MAG: ABC transporter permease [Candidatus Aminicenantes bacterium]|nr:ABC transporter permease [Candidatus Aminicenantes bacterium]